MKKLTLTIACAVVMGAAANAQNGTVNWSGFTSTFIAETNSSISPLFGGTGAGGTAGFGAINNAYYYELLYTSYNGTQAAVPGTLASLNTWQDTTLQAINGPGQNGRIVGNPANTGATVPWANGVTNSIILVGWSANLGTTWGAVSNVLNNWATLGSTVVGQAFFGESVTGYLNPFPSGSNPGVTVFNAAPNANGLPINNAGSNPAMLYALPVPEPATMAMMGLGGLSLLLFRRSRKS